MAGRAIVAVTLVLTVLANGAAAAGYGRCFDSCYRQCVGSDKSMDYYCRYACDKTCGPPAHRPAGNMACQLACVRSSCSHLPADYKGMEVCYGRCYDGCRIRPVSEPPASRPDMPVDRRPPSEPIRPDVYTVSPVSEPLPPM